MKETSTHKAATMTLLKTLLTALAPSGAAAVTIAAINGDRFLSPLNGTGG